MLVKKTSDTCLILLKLMKQEVMWQIGVGLFSDFLISGIPGKGPTFATKILENPFAPLK